MICWVGYSGTLGIFGGRTEITELSGIVPNLPKCGVPVLSLYRTIPECSIWYRDRIPNKYRYPP